VISCYLPGDARIQADEELPDLEVLTEDPHVFEMDDFTQTPPTLPDALGEQQVVSIFRECYGDLVYKNNLLVFESYCEIPIVTIFAVLLVV